MGINLDTQATRSTLMSVDSTLSENITAAQDYIPIASTTNFSTSVVAEVETTNEVVSFTDISENKFEYSEQLDNAYWLDWNNSVSANAGVAPDGTTTADKDIPSTANHAYHGFYHELTATSMISSIYAKPDGYNFLTLIHQATSSTSIGVQFNVSTGVVTYSSGASGTITDAGNGWYRCSIIPDTSIATTHVLINVSDGGAPNTSNYYFQPAWTPDGSSGMLLWGAQLEDDATLSTYLPTTSSALVGLTGVTRGVNGTTATLATSGDAIQQLPYALSEVDMPIRLKGISVSSDGTGAGRFTLCDKIGTTLCDIDIPDTRIYDLDFGGGIIFPNGVFVSNSDNITGYTLYTDKYSGAAL